MPEELNMRDLAVVVNLIVAVDLVEDLLELTVACVLKDKGGSLVLNWLKMNNIVGVNEEEETKRKKESINSGNS